MENEYFIPELGDIHTGYECEYLDPTNDNWGSIIIKQGTIIYKHTVETHIRTPYLTPKQIEAEGWVPAGRAVDIWFNKEGEWDMGSWTGRKAIMHYGLHDKRLHIYVDDFGVDHDVFRGECKDINTFRFIEKLVLKPC